MRVLFMYKPLSIRLLAVLIVTLACVQGAATYWDLYFYVWWLDVPMHLFGGFWISAATITFLLTKHAGSAGNSWSTLLGHALLATIVIGAGWELFEWSVDRLNGLIHFDVADTSADMLNDTIGALCAAWILLRKKKV